MVDRHLSLELQKYHTHVEMSSYRKDILAHAEADPVYSGLNYFLKLREPTDSDL
jgi:hypothetical protein